MNILSTLDGATKIYHSSESFLELAAARKSLADLLAWNETSKMMYAENVASAEVLMMKIHAKEMLLKYVDCKEFSSLAYNQIVEQAKEAIPYLERKGYKKTKVLYEAVLSFVQSIHPLIEKLQDQFSLAEDSNGNITLQDAEKIENVIQEIREIKAKVGEVAPLYVESFTSQDNARFMRLPDVKEMLIVAIDEEIQKYVDGKEKIQKQRPLEFIEKKLKPFKSIYVSEPEVFPQIDLRRNNTSNCFVLYTPFEEEALLYIASIAQKEQLDLLVLDAREINSREARYIDDVCNLLRQRKQHLVILHANELRSGDVVVDELLTALMSFGQNGGNSFLIDGSGKRTLIERAHELTRENAAVRIRDIADVYLTMPSFGGVVELLEEEGLIQVDDYQRVRENLAFVGFVGLNYILGSVRAKEALWKYSQERNSYCKRLAVPYLARLTSQIQLLDSAWGDFSSLSKGEIDNKKTEIDYDAITLVNRNNVRKIMESHHSIFAKCGSIVMYCMTAGEDKTEWTKLPTELKEERLDLATKLVYQILGVVIVPEVSVVPKAEWSHGGAGGVCICGGTQIEYREDCTADYEWTIKAVCHESYHALQHQLERGGWHKELFVELGITAGRIEQWTYNHREGYIDINKNKHSYMIQVIESDARAFELDCFNHGGQILGTLNLE